jgi:hypothetical protein
MKTSLALLERASHFIVVMWILLTFLVVGDGWGYRDASFVIDVHMVQSYSLCLWYLLCGCFVMDMNLLWEC